MKLTVTHNKLPASFYLKGVRPVGSENVGAGSISDLYRGKWENMDVALKRLRVSSDDPSSTRAFERVSRNSIFVSNNDSNYVYLVRISVENLFSGEDSTIHTFCIFTVFQKTPSIAQFAWFCPG